MATILRGMDSSAILINSVEDHAHILFHLSKNRALCDVIESVKKDSSKWIKTREEPFETSTGRVAMEPFQLPIQRSSGGQVH